MTDVLGTDQDKEVARVSAYLHAKSRITRSEARLGLASTPVGDFWIPKRNLSNFLDILSETEAHVYDPPEHPIQKGAVVLDCGANVGAFTKHALRSGASTVVAIELAPEELECLRRTFANEIKKGSVILYPKGVWDKEDWLTLDIDPQNIGAGSVVTSPAKSGPRVQLTTIDKIVSELQLPRVDFIKMDIEGAESHAVEGGRETMRKYHPRMSVSVEHYPEDWRSLPSLVGRLDPDSKYICGRTCCS